MRGRCCLSLALAGAALAAGGRVREPRQWWEVVRADIERFNRPISDRQSASKEGDKPLVRGDRFFCPHEDRSPLKARYLSEPPNPRIKDQLVETVYYCEIEQVYWVHLQGGLMGLNLVTGPYQVGVGSPGPTATGPASRPAAGSLALRLERRGRAGPVAPKAAVPVALVFTNTGGVPFRLNTNLLSATVQFRVEGPRVENEPLDAQPAPLKESDFVRLEPGASHTIALGDLNGGRYRHRLALGGVYLVRVMYRNEQDGAQFGLVAWTGSVAAETMVVEVMVEAK